MRTPAVPPVRPKRPEDYGIFWPMTLALPRFPALGLGWPGPTGIRESTPKSSPRCQLCLLRLVGLAVLLSDFRFDRSRLLRRTRTGIDSRAGETSPLTRNQSHIELGSVGILQVLELLSG